VLRECGGAIGWEGEQYSGLTVAVGEGRSLKSSQSLKVHWRIFSVLPAAHTRCQSDWCCLFDSRVAVGGMIPFRGAQTVQAGPKEVQENH
jgi:hypothetical protein